MQVLICAGADVNKADWSGFTALIAAAEMGNPKVVLLSIATGADVKHANKKGDILIDCTINSHGKECRVCGLSKV